MGLGKFFGKIISGPIEAIGNVVKGPIEEWQKRKTIRVQAKAEVEKINAQVAVTKALGSLEMAKNGQKIEGDWDMKALEMSKNSLKDEYLMFLLTFPLLMIYLGAFCAGFKEGKVMSDEMIKAVQALKYFPLWYSVLLMGIVANAFGLRWLVSSFMKKSYNSVKEKFLKTSKPEIKPEKIVENKDLKGSLQATLKKLNNPSIEKYLETKAAV